MSQTSSQPKVSIVFRALNEEKWFGDALKACHEQVCDGFDMEIVLVDSGSTDRTLEIADEHDVRVFHIKKSDFTFGRSLNMGCEAATGDYLIFISAHCIPAHDRWLGNLIQPLRENRADYVSGKQIGHDVTRYSEHQVFAQYFGPVDKVPRADIFCNNANAAISKQLWARYRFDEAVTGLEDLVLAKKIAEDGGALGYVADAPVYHIHEETLTQVRRRYYREALTLREIFPAVHFNFGDFVRYFLVGVLHDFSESLNDRKFLETAPGIIAFRLMQYWGAYRGHNEHRVLSRAQKEQYYYPRPEESRGRSDLDRLQRAPVATGGASKTEH
ncbi:MAG: glycosyltransferase family 2 protein [Pseudomonadota bacterium]